MDEKASISQDIGSPTRDQHRNLVVNDQVGSVQSRLAISKRKEPACRQSPSRANTAGIFEDH